LKGVNETDQPIVKDESGLIKWLISIIRLSRGEDYTSNNYERI